MGSKPSVEVVRRTPLGGVVVEDIRAGGRRVHKRHLHGRAKREMKREIRRIEKAERRAMKRGRRYGGRNNFVREEIIDVGRRGPFHRHHHTTIIQDNRLFGPREEIIVVD